LFENFFFKEDYIEAIKLLLQLPNDECFLGFISAKEAKDFLLTNVKQGSEKQDWLGTFVVRCSTSLNKTFVFCVLVNDEMKKSLNATNIEGNILESRAVFKNGKYVFRDKTLKLKDIYTTNSTDLLKKPFSRYFSGKDKNNL